MPLAVNEPSAEINALAHEWHLLEALMGGTSAMRRAGKKFLPQWPAEEQNSYDARLKTATLFPAYRRTVGVMAAKPFSRELVLSDDTPASIVNWAENIDLQGVSLHAFSAELFDEALAFGLAGVLVDYPIVKAPPQGLTVAAVESAGLRPYFVRVFHNQILGWRAALQGGRMRLLQLRLSESREADDGPYGTKCLPQVRVLFPGGWELWEKSEKTGKFDLLYDSGTTTLSEIPFVPFYGDRDGFMVGKPPMQDLAYLNAKHWQSQSDQDTILHVARVPILAMIGAEDSTGLAVGAASAVKLPAGADLKFVEHSGAAIGAGETSLAALQDQMIQTGGELLVKKPGDRSATEASNDAEANKSDLQRLSETFEDSLDQALQFMADYARLPSGGSVSLFKDYGAGTLSDASAQLVKDLNLAGIISKPTVISELKRRGTLAMEVDAQAEADAVAAEGPALGMAGVDPNGLPTAPAAPAASAARTIHIKRDPTSGDLTATEK